MNAMNIKESEYKYDFFISTAYTILSVGNPLPPPPPVYVSKYDNTCILRAHYVIIFIVKTETSLNKQNYFFFVTNMSKIWSGTRNQELTWVPIIPKGLGEKYMCIPHTINLNYITNQTVPVY